MAYTTPTTAAGQVLTNTIWNASVRDNLEYLKDRADNPPRANVYHNATQSLTSGVAAALAFNSEYNDSEAVHDTVSNTSRLTVPSGEGGWWLYTAFVEFAANATGQRTIYLVVNNSTIFSYLTVDAAASGVTRLAVAGINLMTEGQYVEVGASQNSGGALNVSANPYFAGIRIA